MENEKTKPIEEVSDEIKSLSEEEIKTSEEEIKRQEILIKKLLAGEKLVFNKDNLVPITFLLQNNNCILIWDYEEMIKNPEAETLSIKMRERGKDIVKRTKIGYHHNPGYHIKFLDGFGVINTMIALNSIRNDLIFLDDFTSKFRKIIFCHVPDRGYAFCDSSYTSYPFEIFGGLVKRKPKEKPKDESVDTNTDKKE